MTVRCCCQWVGATGKRAAPARVTAAWAAALLALLGGLMATPVAADFLNITRDAVLLARTLVDPAHLEVITSGALAPQFNGHSRSAGVMYLDSTPFPVQEVYLTTGNSVASIRNLRYNVLTEPAPTYPDIPNTALGGAESHDTAVLDFSVRVKSVPSSSARLFFYNVEFHTTELMPDVAALHATPSAVDDRFNVEANGTIRIQSSVKSLRALMTAPEPPSTGSLDISYRRLSGLWRLFQANLYPARTVRRGDVFRIKIRLGDVGDRLGESFLVLYNRGVRIIGD